jgi:thymidylate synthase (FAD)
MVDDLQELVFKCGYAATEQSPILERSSSYGSKPLYKLTIYRERNSRPRIGWTKTDRKKQVSSVEYNGEIHCVTVPNGTLYVRRNGKPVWSGNSPFEHSYFTFYVKAPIFVWREHMRHRISSYSEESGRYAVLKPEFYIPARERNLQQIGKTGHYQFIEGTNDQYAMTKVLFEKQCIDAYQNYEQLLANGIAKEVARIALPLNIYSSAYVTMNARALMNFLSLRQHVEGSHFPSYPQREIEMVAERYEEILKEHMPITYAAFAANGRVAP